MTHYWTGSDLGTFILDDQFVAEAEAKWPGKVRLAQDVFEPRWVPYVWEPLSVLHRQVFAAGLNIKRVKTIEALPRL